MHTSTVACGACKLPDGVCGGLVLAAGVRDAYHGHALRRAEGCNGKVQGGQKLGGAECECVCAQLLAMGRDAFERLMGPAEEVLAEAVHAYEALNAETRQAEAISRSNSGPGASTLAEANVMGMEGIELRKSLPNTPPVQTLAHAGASLPPGGAGAVEVSAAGKCTVLASPAPSLPACPASEPSAADARGGSSYDGSLAADTAEAAVASAGAGALAGARPAGAERRGGGQSSVVAARGSATPLPVGPHADDAQQSGARHGPAPEAEIIVLA